MTISVIFDSEQARKLANVKQAIDNHDHLKSSYHWTPNGGASSRRYDEERYTFSIKVTHEGHVYEYHSNVQVSVKNFYYTGRFIKDGVKRDVRVFKTLLAQLVSEGLK